MIVTCEHCHQTFDSDWGDEESLEEARLVFKDGINPEERAVICDECYELFLEWIKKTHPDALRKAS